MHYKFTCLQNANKLSGWLAFMFLVVSIMVQLDTRQRGGLIANADEGVSFRCFNCGFKQVGGMVVIILKMKKFMRWLNVPDDTITKLALQVSQTKTDSTGHKTFKHFKFVSQELPIQAKSIHEWADYKALESGGIDKDLFKVLEYIAPRKLNLMTMIFIGSSEAGYRDRLIIPFYYREKVVGYTARKVVESKVKYLSEQHNVGMFSQHR